MSSNQDLQIDNSLALRPPPPALPCSQCSRYFYSKGGRKLHILAKHSTDGLEPQEPGPSPSPSLSPSPVPPSSPSPPPHGGSNADVNMDIEHPNFDLDAPDYFGFGQELSRNSSPGDDGHVSDPPHVSRVPRVSRAPRVTHAPRISRVYHLRLSGTSSRFFVCYISTVTALIVGLICDKNGVIIPPDSPPPPRDSDQGPDKWTPYDSRLEFEVADFLFRRNQMSAGDINFLLGLWAASLAVHDDEPPFSNAHHMYDTIDSTPLGDVAWSSLTLHHNGTRPIYNIPSWMEAEYDIWFRNPCSLVHNLLSNPDFESGFNYVPFQERTVDGVHRFCDFMSANWSWRQAVSSRYSLFY